MASQLPHDSPRTQVRLLQQTVISQQSEIDKLHTLVSAQHEVIQHRRTYIGIGNKRRRVEEDEESEDYYGMDDESEGHYGMDGDEDDGDEENEGTDREGVEDELPRGIRDDMTVRCSKCAWEIVEGFCHGCGLEHADLSDEEDYTAHNPVYVSTSTDEDLLYSDCQLAPRGTTPLLNTSNVEVPWDWTAHFDRDTRVWHSDRSQEYLSLLSRGATELMCETFRLEFEDATGIVAWADQELFDEFSGEAMREGEEWKIHLGRRIQLDEGDLDGRQFIEELLEQAMLFPCADEKEYGSWITIKKNSVWVTKPLPADDVVAINSDDEDEEFDREARKEDAAMEADPDDPLPTAIANEYEYSETDEEELSFDPQPPFPSYLRDYGFTLQETNIAPSDDDDEDIYMEDREVEEVETSRRDEALAWNSDSADSDFDPDEMLSGDEDIIGDRVDFAKYDRLFKESGGAALKA